MMDIQELSPEMKFQQLLQFGVDREAARAAVQQNPRASLSELMDWIVDQFPRFKQNQSRSMMQVPKMQQMHQMSMFDGMQNSFGPRRNKSQTVSLPWEPKTRYEEETEQKLLGFLKQARQLREANRLQEMQARRQYLKEVGQTEDSMHERYKQWLREDQLKKTQQKLQEQKKLRQRIIDQRKRNKSYHHDLFVYALGLALMDHWKQRQPDKKARNGLVDEQKKIRDQKKAYREEHPQQFIQLTKRQEKNLKQYWEFMNTNGEDTDPHPVLDPQEEIQKRVAEAYKEADQILLVQRENRRKKQEEALRRVGRLPIKMQEQKPQQPYIPDMKQLTEEQVYEFEELITQCKKLEVYSIANRQVAKTLLDTLLKILAKIDQNFTDKKYRRLKQSNPTLKDKVFIYPEAANFMNWLGFQEINEEFVMDDDSRDERQLKKMAYILKQYRKSLS